MKRLLLVLCAAAIAGCAPQQNLSTIRRHPDYTPGSPPYRKVMLVPPEVRVMKLTFHGDLEAQSERVDEYRMAGSDRLGTWFSSNGFSVVDAKLSEAELAEDDLRLAWTEVQAGRSHLVAKAYRKPGLPLGEAWAYRGTMGPRVGLFSERAGAEALAFWDLAVVEKSSGMVAKDTFFVLLHALGGAVVRYPKSFAFLEVMIIDGVTGELLWSNRGIAYFYEGVDVRWFVDQLVEDLPGHWGSKRRGPEAAATPDSTEPVGEQDPADSAEPEAAAELTDASVEEPQATTADEPE